MLKKEITTETKVVRYEKPTERLCDICGKPVNPHNWFRITTSHSDWGNDSIESYETGDACSPECVLKFTREYVEDSFDNEHNTKVIEIEHRRSLGNDDSDSWFGRY